ncbi:MAG: hypothetical protein A2Z34_07480 [Planctomycetes bacterium RBG_16_59_8]|nr:MAG: hypothetical protein A2Z34_07480 [Planctomycetes bacterium RBG_16_59_8]
MKRCRKDRGFTLVEIMVALALMLILISSVAVIFSQSTDTYIIEKSRLKIYKQVKNASRIVTDDLQGCIPFNTGRQRFIMENGVIQDNGTINYGVGGGHDSSAGDRLTFRTTTRVSDTMVQTVEIVYDLVQSAVDERKKTIVRYDETGSEVRSRPMYILRRTMRAVNPADPSKFDQPVKDGAGKIIHDWNGTSSHELCEFLLSFNVSYYADNHPYSELDPSPCPETDPLGDGAGKNDPPSTPAYRIPKVRITMIVIDDAGDVQERVFALDVDIPMG